jgi:two-component system, NtrC family, response regulator AtoC
MSVRPSILVVDDEPQMLSYLRTILETGSYRVETASSGHEALLRLQKGTIPALVLLDVLMPGMDGLETLARMMEIASSVKVIMLSCMSDPKTIVQSIQLGAQDYLAKPFEKAELDSAIRRHLSDRTAEGRLSPQDIATEELDGQTEFVAASEQMRRIRVQVGILADVDVPVLLLGESGTGKGVVARLIHELSARSSHPFLKVNCAALPAELLESELFGYEAGAFTGAVKSKPGKFEQCNKGTILLDEIGELPVSLQAKLLQVLQDKEFSRLGSRSVVRVDVRVIAATNVDIPKALATGKLRQDLYYRLNAFTINIPPLREQQGAVPVLMRYFMSRVAAAYGREPLPLSPSLLEAATAHDWPGNVRELENVVRRYLIIRDDAQILRDLGASKHKPISDSPLPERVSQVDGLKSLVRDLKSEAEIEAIGRTLEHTNWNRKQAARLLNISYKALLYKIKRYGLGKTSCILIWVFHYRHATHHIFRIQINAFCFLASVVLAIVLMWVIVKPRWIAQVLVFLPELRWFSSSRLARRRSLRSSAKTYQPRLAIHKITSMSINTSS